MLDRIEGLRQPREIGLHAVDPDGVGIDQEERRRAQFRQRLFDAAAGAEQQAALVGEHDMRARAGGEMPLQCIGQMMDVDHGAVDAGLRQAIEHVVDQRLAGNRHQRLWQRVGERAHAQAQSGSEHHRSVGMFGHAGQIVFSAGTWVPYQVLSAAREGCASARWR